jgi:minor extracellular serine protease Vpr
MLRTKLRSFAGATAVALALAGTGSRASVQDVADDGGKGLWFIELDGSVDAFRQKAKASGLEFTERYVYKRVWKGLSVKASADAASLFGRLQGVKAVFPVLTVSRPPVETISPELAHALAMTGADAAQASGLTGAGIKVAVMDTGIDYHHPDLGGGFGSGNRVAFGHDFVGDRYNAAGSGGDLIPHPDDDPDDCAGHGTHVAGIVGADGDPATGGAVGVAPGVTFGAYRVFGCVGSTSADIMLAAMDRALDDGMDILNMSIGSAFQTWPQYPTAAGADFLVSQGMVVVASIGNSGASGVYSASAPGVGRDVIGVASIDNTHVNVESFIANPGGHVMGYTPLGGTATAEGPPAPPTTGTTPEIVFVGRGCVDGDLSTPGNQTDPYLADPAGKVALIVRGVCTFNEKYARAADAGAVGVMVQNSAPGIFFGGSVLSRGIFGVGISQADGNTLRGLPAPTATWTDDRIDVANPTAGLASSFTSFGLDAELALKPDIAAPGGLIRSTWPLEDIEAAGYATISGTSMASPHVAGAAALFLQAHPGASPDAVKTALQNSADPTVWSGNPGLGLPEFVHRQGAGLVDIDDAIEATTTVTPGKLSLGEGGSAAAPKTATLTIANHGSGDVTYDLTHQVAPATAATFPPINAFGSFASVTFTPSSVTVPAGSSATVGIRLTPPTAALRAYGGYLVVTPQGGGARLRVPYAGLSGDYQAIQVLAPGGCTLSPFPGIFKRGGETACTAPAPPAMPAKLDIAVTRQPEGAVFNVEDRTDRPVILYHRAHQSRRLEIRAVDVATDQWHLVAFADFVTRNAANGISFVNGGFSTYTWDGKRIFTNAAGKVHRLELPDGAYKLQIVVTKALAEADNPAHVETWTSPTINIVRN